MMRRYMTLGGLLVGLLVVVAAVGGGAPQAFGGDDDGNSSVPPGTIEYDDNCVTIWGHWHDAVLHQKACANPDGSCSITTNWVDDGGVPRADNDDDVCDGSHSENSCYYAHSKFPDYCPPHPGESDHSSDPDIEPSNEDVGDEDGNGGGGAGDGSGYPDGDAFCPAAGGAVCGHVTTSGGAIPDGNKPTVHGQQGNGNLTSWGVASSTASSVEVTPANVAPSPVQSSARNFWTRR